MKKIFAIAVFLFAVCTVTTTLNAQTTKADSTATTVLNTVSAGAATVDATLNTLHVDFGGATEFKDSVAAVLTTASTDPQVAAIKDKTLELVELGKQVKEGNKVMVAPLILGILTVLSLVIGFLVSHFGKFGKKKTA